MKLFKNIMLLTLIALTTGCVATTTKYDAYPLMYGDQKPLSILIAPAINESTAADAGELINVTINQPFSNHGYYILPIPIVRDIFQNEGITDGAEIKGIPTAIFKSSFGADAVMFITITDWDRNYIVIAGNVTVALEYVLISTETNEILWSYSQEIVVDTSGATGSIIGDLIATAVTTAVTDYIPVAMQVNNTAVVAFPYGNYHPRSGEDRNDKTVIVENKDAPLVITVD